MKNLLLLFTLVGITAFTSSQSNLEFNQVINLKPGDSYQVPTNKVLKIESFSIQSNNLCMPRTGTKQGSCFTQNGWVATTVGLYQGFTYLTIGDISFSVPNKDGNDLTSSCLKNPDCYPIDNLNLGTINTPIWLREGKQVIINNSSISITISAIEFNIVN